MLQAVKDALADYFTKKKSRLSSNTVKALLRAAPSPDWIPALIAHHQSARNDFLKCEALQLLLVTLQPAKVRIASEKLLYISRRSVLPLWWGCVLCECKCCFFCCPVSHQS